VKTTSCTGHFVTGLAIVLTLARCGSPENDATPPTSPVDGAPGEPARPAADEVTAYVRVVDLQGSPVSGVTPIATARPNAFDKPVAQGALTDDDGKSWIRLPTESWLYVRGWDPTLRMFANNLYEVPPGEAPIGEELKLIMVEGGAIRAQLVDHSGRPVIKENVGLMMFHPERGPWWPGEGDTDENGFVTFAPVPAGKYVIKMKAVRSGQIEVPDVLLLPRGEADLGRIQLR